MQLETLLPVLNGLSAAVFVLNAERRVLLVNDAARAHFGDALSGVDFVQAVRNPGCLKAIAKVLAGKDKSEVTVELRTPMRATFQVTVTRYMDGDPAGPGAIVSMENISHIIDAEHMRSEFVANVSHEMRSPLTALTGFIETLQGAAKDDADARAHFLGIMAREAGRMSRLIGDLLSLSRVEADAHSRPDENIDLGRLLRQVATTLEPLASRENVTVDLRIPDDIQTAISGDHDQLQQVFTNLLENAIKYGRAGGEVTVSVTAKDKAIGIRGAALQVDITDQGGGIESEHIARLTERFYRVDKGRSREMGGTGLGLAIVKHILTRHRGRLQVSSTLGQGSTFTVFLPA